MRIIKCFFVALVVAVFLSGCAGYADRKRGDVGDYQYVRDSVVIGKTKLSEVREKIGEPDGQEQRGDGSVAWTYKSSFELGIVSLYGRAFTGDELNAGKRQSATILFDANGIAVGVSGSDVDGGKTSSFSRGVLVDAYGISFPAQPPQQAGAAGGVSASSVPPTSMTAEQPPQVTSPTNPVAQPQTQTSPPSSSEKKVKTAPKKPAPKPTM